MGVDLRREELMDKKRVQFDEFLEIIETMDVPRRKEFIDRFYKSFFNSIYDGGAFEGTQKSVEIMRESSEKRL